jgi:hypothetical protein
VLVIPAAAKTKQIASLGGYVYREAPQGALRFVGFFFFDVGDSSCRENQANHVARRLRLQRSPTRCDALCGVFLFLVSVILAAAKTKQIASLGGYVYREAPQGALRFVGFFFF